MGESEGQAYIAMELVEGQTLSAWLESGALPVEEVLRYGAQLAEALTHAHERGVIHRDLKSANIIITGDQLAKVLRMLAGGRRYRDVAREPDLSKNTVAAIAQRPRLAS